MSRPLQSPNYTQIPNAILDNMASYSDAELRVLLCVCRQTFGWQKQRCKASASFIAKATGMSDQGVINGVKRLLSNNDLGREKEGDSFAYWIEVDGTNGVGTPLPTALSGGTNGVERQGTNGVGTNKEKGKENITPSPTRFFSDGWCSAYQAKFGKPYVYGAADGVQAARALKSGWTPAALLETAKAAWEKTDPRAHWNCVNRSATVREFISALPQITKELTTTAPPVAQARRFSRPGDCQP